MEKADNTEAARRQHQLRWLEDAPLFSDPVSIARFHDAIVRPTSTTNQVTYAASEARIQEFKAELGIEAGVGIGLPQFLAAIFDFKAEAKAKAKGGATTTSKEGKTVTLNVTPVQNAERQLQDVIVQYLLRYPDRFFFSQDVRVPKWTEPQWISETPRPLVFLSLPDAIEADILKMPKTQLVPTAAEFENGEVVQIYSTLKFGKKEDENPPDYPQVGESEADLVAERKKYWSWFEDNFNPTAAMLAVEAAAKGRGRIHWIDYRLPIDTDGTTLHLHVSPRGQYPTGDFAYNLIKRGYKHGIRLVGTLKSEPDMNVLAIYER